MEQESKKEDSPQEQKESESQKDNSNQDSNDSKGEHWKLNEQLQSFLKFKNFTLNNN